MTDPFDNDRPAIRMPEPTGPVPDVFTGDQLDAAKVAAVQAETANWPPEQKMAMLSALRATVARAELRTKYAHPAEIARAVDPSYVITPAIEEISTSIETVLTSPRQINLEISMPPQEGKSTIAAVFTPIRALQHNPHRRIILATYADSLAENHSRAMRELIDTFGTGVTDPLTGLAVEDRLGLRLARGANKISAWSVEGGRGGLIAAGIGSRMTGLPADLLIIDDPFKNMMEADSSAHRERIDAWFSSVARTRLAPDASIIMIQCMTGDTPVLRPDGTETPLADICSGDEIATYDAGVLSTSTVRNHASQGYDSIYTITMESGRVVRANARHPFLVLDDDGVESWVRLELLQPGDRLMATASGTACPAQSATDTSTARGCVNCTTSDSERRAASALSPLSSAETGISSTATASVSPTTTECSPSRAGFVDHVENRLDLATVPLIGPASYASIIATKQDVCGAFSAMTATSLSDEPVPPCGCAKALTISIDTVRAIEPAGVAEVFDIEVERTENFIANGLVSHNTRWHPEDLAGKVIAGERSLPRRERSWRVLNIPAIAEEGIADALGREPGTPMVSARDTPEAKRNFPKIRKEVGERTWYALYQGNPTNPAGGIFQRAWFDNFRELGPPAFPMTAVVGIDPADSGEGDEAGVVAGMLSAESGRPRVTLTHDRSGQYTSDQWAVIGVQLALEIGARVIGVESYQSSETYVQVVRRAYRAIHDQVVAKARASGTDVLTPLERRALPDMPPFQIRKWRGATKADAVARAGGLSQSCETGRCRTVEVALAMFEAQACDWQAGQHQPDRVAAAIIVHDILMDLAGGQLRVAGPPKQPPPPPAWMRRKIG